MALVSIGVPVYNGGAFLNQTLQSLLAQTFTDFEIVISDNASTDSTAAIAREFAARDHRIRYHRSERLLMPAENHNRALNLSGGRYFKWAAHDDVCAPRFLERCVGILERDPSVVLCYPRAAIIDQTGATTKTYTYEIPTAGPAPARRFGALVCADHRRHGAFEIYGLIRKSALDRIPRMGNYVRGDSIVLARLALLGRFHELEEVMFFSRDHQTRSVRTMPDRIRNGRTRLHRLIGTGALPPVEWWDPSRRDRLNFPEWRVLREYLDSIREAPIPAMERARCFIWLARAMPRYAHKLARDLIIAAEQLTVGRPSQQETGRKPASAGISAGSPTKAGGRV